MGNENRPIEPTSGPDAGANVFAINSVRVDLRQLIHGMKNGLHADMLRIVRDFAARYPQQFISAVLSEIAAEPEPAVRITLASIVIAAAQQGSLGQIDADHVTRSEDMILRALRSSSPNERWVAATCYAYNIRPSDAAVGRLIETLRDRDRSVRLVTAAALFKVLGVADGHATLVEHTQLIVRRLRRGIRSKHYLSATFAARALARLDHEDCCAAMIRALAVIVDHVQQYHVLETLESVGTGSADAKEALFDYVHDKERPSFLRGIAARTLVRIIDADEAHTLLYVLRQGEEEVVKAALQGLALRPQITESLVSGIISVLRDEDAELRAAALRALSMIPRASELALPILLDMVGVELQFIVVDELASAIVAAGDHVALAMIEKIKSLNVASLMVATIVLRRLGLAGAKALVAAMLIENEPWIRVVLISVVRDMGESTAVVVKELGVALLATVDDDPAVFIAQAIATTGRAALSVLPALVTAAATRSRAVAEHVERAIRNIGPDAIPPLRSLIASLPSEVQERLQRAVYWEPPIKPRLIARMDRIGTKDLLRYLLACDFMLTNSGRPVHTRELASALCNNDIARQHGVTMERTNIQRAFTRVQRHLAGDQRLIERGILTSAAKRTLSDVRKFLSSKGLVPRFRSD